MDKHSVFSSLDSIREDMMQNSRAVLNASNMDDEAVQTILELIFVLDDTLRKFSDLLTDYMES